MSDPGTPPPGAGADAGRASPEGAPPYRAPRTDALLRRAIELIDQARPMPLSASSMINKEEILPVLQEALAGLPEELRAARWLLKERQDFLARMKREGDELMAAARARAEQMVQRTEVVKSAEQRARRVIDDAEDRARRLKLETEDWCDQKLGGLEVVLQKTLRTVDGGRARLQGASATPPIAAEPPDPAEPEGFFDQDSS